MGIINFTKMNGAGNDFILIDSSKNPNLILNSDLIRKLCHRRKGVGGDGILFIKESRKNDFELEYYNSDGSIGSLCGNGARCSIKYAFLNRQITNNQTNFFCNGNLYSGSKNSDNLITFNLLDAENLKLNLSIGIGDSKINCHFINTGSPHVVIYWNDIKRLFTSDFFEFNMFEFGKKIRYAKEFHDEGTNVNVIHFEDGKRLIRTYERGVEDETLACGTGTVAASIISNLIEKVVPPITYTTFDKDLLIVNFEKKNEKFTKISLTGPAKINYIGSYNF